MVAPIEISEAGLRECYTSRLSDTARAAKSADYSSLFRRIANGDQQAEIRLANELGRLPFDEAYDDMVEATTHFRLAGNVDQTISNALTRHPAGLAERTPVLIRAGQDYFDEILGLPRAELESDEKTARGGQIPDSLGVGMPHHFWFSYPLVLRDVLDIAHTYGAKRIADLGCGTGRLGLYIGFVDPKIQFKGLDIYAPRVQAARDVARRWGFSKRINFEEQDLLDVKLPLPTADLYFIYGPTNDIEINRRVIERLEPIARTRRIIIVTQHPLTDQVLGSMPWLHRDTAITRLNVYVSTPGVQ